MGRSVSLRLPWADLLKVLAVFAVVLIHTAAPLLLAYRERGAGVWWIGNLYDSIARWCIPVFFMLSGAFVIEGAGRSTTALFLRHRFGRIGVPFLVWSAIYFVWSKHYGGLEASYASFFGFILRRPAYYHLWFLYALMGLYLLAPPLAIFLEAAGRRGIVYLLVLWFLFGSLLPTVGSYLGGPVLFMASTASSVFSYSGFFVLGHVLRSSRCPPRFRLLLGILFVVGLAATLTGTYMVTVVENGGEFRGVFYEYYSPNVSLMAVTLFMLVKSVRTVSGRATRILSYMGACVPGIYLVHALVIVVLKRGVTGVVIDQYLIHPAAGVPLFAGVVFIISFAGVGLIRLIPLVRRILP